MPVLTCGLRRRKKRPALDSRRMSEGEVCGWWEEGGMGKDAEWRSVGSVGGGEAAEVGLLFFLRLNGIIQIKKTG